MQYMGWSPKQPSKGRMVRREKRVIEEGREAREKRDEGRRVNAVKK